MGNDSSAQDPNTGFTNFELGDSIYPTSHAVDALAVIVDVCLRDNGSKLVEMFSILE